MCLTQSIINVFYFTFVSFAQTVPFPHLFSFQAHDPRNGRTANVYVKEGNLEGKWKEKTKTLKCRKPDLDIELGFETLGTNK